MGRKGRRQQAWFGVQISDIGCQTKIKSIRLAEEYVVLESAGKISQIFNNLTNIQINATE